jgi:hypothetical protein
MNLHGFVAGNIDAVNPRISCLYKASTGYTYDAAGAQVPAYAAPVTVLARFQPMTSDDLKMVDAVDQQRNRTKVYLFGESDGVVRSQLKGGDIITDPQNNVWLVSQPMEQWAQDWCSVAVTLQNGS